ncbi:MAG: hypothetical protein SGARI_005295 [Bacillariaceae sp.]
MIQIVTAEEALLDAIKHEFETWQEEEFEKALTTLNIDDIVAEAEAQKAKKEKEEQEFEEALMALNLDDIVAQAKAATCDKPKQIEQNDEAKEDDDQSHDGGISDEALMQAVLDNPEVFQ